MATELWRDFFEEGRKFSVDTVEVGSYAVCGDVLEGPALVPKSGLHFQDSPARFIGHYVLHHRHVTAAVIRLHGGLWQETHGESSLIVAMVELLLFTVDATNKSKLVSFHVGGLGDVRWTNLLKLRGGT